MKIQKLTITLVTALAFVLSGCSSSPDLISTPDARRASWVNGACNQEIPGVTLSVDFKGKVTTHCAVNYSGNGWDLFGAAGFEVQGTNKYPTAFACKINGEPADTACDESGASGAYWGYYVSDAGVWSYATTGASDHESKCGSWEGWVYMESEDTVSQLPDPEEFSCN